MGVDEFSLRNIVPYTEYKGAADGTAMNRPQNGLLFKKWHRHFTFLFLFFNGSTVQQIPITVRV